MKQNAVQLKMCLRLSICNQCKILLVLGPDISFCVKIIQKRICENLLNQHTDNLNKKRGKIRCNKIKKSLLQNVQQTSLTNREESNRSSCQHQTELPCKFKQSGSQTKYSNKKVDNKKKQLIQKINTQSTKIQGSSNEYSRYMNCRNTLKNGCEWINNNLITMQKIKKQIFRMNIVQISNYQIQSK